MAEIIVSVVVEALLSKLISVASEEIGLAWGFKTELKLLSSKSTMVLALMHDAARSHVKGKVVTLWIKNLKNAAYDADDLLDEFAFEMFRRQLEMKNKARSFLSPISFRFKMSRKIKDVNMMLDQVIEDGTKLGLHQLVFQIAEFVGKFSSIRKNFDTHPFVEDATVFGRDIDKSKIVTILLQSESEEALSVIAIVGLGGLGKTTLAQMVYKDEKIIRTFEHKMWICVSNDFSVARILKNMCDSLMMHDGESWNIEAMIHRLRKKIKRSKYLLILDDVWNTNAENWDLLRNSLLGINASKDSKILVTTRSDKVVLTSQIHQAYHLGKLSEEDSWSMFSQRAFACGGAKETSYLVEIGKRLVKRCGGVPLAVKTLGAMMYSKEGREWIAMEESNIWGSSDEETGIMPALRLSFDQLSISEKQCFAYCSIFPKDFMFDKDSLIQLWIAQGFIQPPEESNLVMEDVGNDYFKSLLWISFFQDVEMDKYGNITHCKMHDLVHDLVQHVSKSDCLVYNDTKVKNIDDNDVRHIYLGVKEDIIIQSFLNENAKRYRTLSLASYVPDNVFIKTKYLRVLMLKGSSIKELSPKISKLKHLRFLDVSNTEITTFPTSITKLYNLQTLRLMDCENFEKFPEGLENLVSLRHLYFNQIKKMPSKVGLLTCIQTLPYFDVSEHSGHQIEELRPLSSLRGKLELRNLEHVRDKEEASRANLVLKSKLYKLKFKWTDERRKSSENEESVLEGLRPPPHLKSLTIENFLGGKFPSWMKNIGHSALPQSLVKIKLCDCLKCEVIPSLGELPHLKLLVIMGLHNVKHIGPEFYTENEGIESINNFDLRNIPEVRTFFPALEKLMLFSMDSLVEWKEPRDVVLGLSVVFPRLQALIIGECYKLVSIPSHFPALIGICIVKVERGILTHISRNVTTLENIRIENGSTLESLPRQLFPNNKTSLTNLRIQNCKKLKFIPQDGLQILTSLNYLKIKECPMLKSIPCIHGLTSLRTLKIVDCEGITRQPIGLGTCTSLQKFQIYRCPSLIPLQEEDLRELKYLSYLTIGEFSEKLDAFSFLCSGDSIEPYLKRVEFLVLVGWQKLKALPDHGQHLHAVQNLIIFGFDGVVTLPDWLGDLSRLRNLGIKNCKNLKYLPSTKSMRRLTNLAELSILECPILIERCERDKGAEWFKISHIPRVKFDMVVVQDLNSSL